MSDTKDLKLAFTGVAVSSEDLVVVTSVRGDVPDDAEISHELVYIYERQEWTAYDAKDKNIVAATIDETADEIALMSPDGFVLRLLTGGTVREEVDPSDDGPSALVQLRHMRRLHGVTIVAGMARRVYVRSDKDGRWTAIDQGCFLPRAQRKSAIGFNAIDGWSPEDLWAVGYKGEIWRRRDGTWTQADSPTNATLMSVTCADKPRSFVAVGLGGVVLFGDDDGIQLIAQDEPRGNLWSVVCFKGSYFLAGDDGVFRLDGPNFDVATKVSLPSRSKPSTSYLSAGNDVLWSVGDRDMFMSADGAKWKRIPNP